MAQKPIPEAAQDKAIAGALPEGPYALTQRLQRIADCVPFSSIVADVGCDHGHLLAHLLQTKCPRAVALDISPPSLAKTRRLMEALRLTDRVRFAVADGLSGIQPSDQVDTLVISGMGCDTIVGILQRGKACTADKRLILQPNVEAMVLRAYLLENGFLIQDEELVFCQGRYYPILVVVQGQEKRPYSPVEMRLGRRILEKHPPLLLPLIRHRLKSYAKALDGAKQGLCKHLEDLEETGQAADPSLRPFSRVSEIMDEIAIYQEAESNASDGSHALSSD